MNEGCGPILLFLVLLALWGISDTLDSIHHDLSDPKTVAAK